MCQHFVIRRRRAPPRQSRGTAAGRGQPQDRANLDQPLIPVYATDDAQPHPTEPSSHQRQPHGSGVPLGEQPRKHRHTQQTDNTSTTAKSAVQERISSRRSRANRTAAVTCTGATRVATSAIETISVAAVRGWQNCVVTAGDAEPAARRPAAIVPLVAEANARRYSPPGAHMGCLARPGEFDGTPSPGARPGVQPEPDRDQ